ncbi:MAG: hypothetical protein HS115_09685 [Spirochaetales bacterium]|nr:hypothetical protein [Spirochaetales bacterium]
MRSLMVSLLAMVLSACLVTDRFDVKPRKATLGAHLKKDIAREAMLGWKMGIILYGGEKGVNSDRLREHDTLLLRVGYYASEHMIKIKDRTFYTRDSVAPCLDQVFTNALLYTKLYLERAEDSFIRSGSSLTRIASYGRFEDSTYYAASAARDCKVEETGNVFETGEFGW